LEGALKSCAVSQVHSVSQLHSVSRVSAISRLSPRLSPLSPEQQRWSSIKITKSHYGGEKEKKKSCGTDSDAHIRELQDEVRFHFSNAQYKDSLDVSITLMENCVDHFGEKHPVTASSYNNVGLMNKMLGNYEASRKMYHEALGIYLSAVGKDHKSYAAALNNLGNLDRAQAQQDETISSMERLQLYGSAVEYFQEALAIREVELGEEHPHTITSRTNLGSALAAQILSSKEPKLHHQSWIPAEKHLRKALKISMLNPRGTLAPSTSTDEDRPQIRTAMAANAAQNLAVVLKQKADLATRGKSNHHQDASDMYAQAKTLYEDALSARTHLLGESHPDTTATLFSLAELIHAMGDEKGANVIRQKIIDYYKVTEVDGTETDTEDR